MKAIITRTSETIFYEQKNPNIKIFGTLKQLIEFIDNSNNPVVIDVDNLKRFNIAGLDFSLEIYDDYRE